MNTKSGSLCEKVIENKKRMGYKNCWYSEVKEDAEKYKVKIDEVTKLQNSEWKRMMKRRLEESIQKQSKVLKSIVFRRSRDENSKGDDED